MLLKPLICVQLSPPLVEVYILLVAVTANTLLPSLNNTADFTSALLILILVQLVPPSEEIYVVPVPEAIATSFNRGYP